MKIIAQSHTPSAPYYLHIGYVSASQNYGAKEGISAFIVVVVFFLALKFFWRSGDRLPEEMKLIQDGTRLFDDRKYEAALECFEMAILKNPYYDKGYYHKGHTLIKLDKKAEAVACFKKYLETTSDRASAEAIGEVIETLNKKEV